MFAVQRQESHDDHTEKRIIVTENSVKIFRKYLGKVQSVIQNIMKSLHVETLFDFCKRRVETVKQGNKKQNQTHSVSHKFLSFP